VTSDFEEEVTPLHRQNPDPPSRSPESPLFVVGMPRSGTKLLRGLLTRHPRIRIPIYETEFLPQLARWVRERGIPHDEFAFERMYRSVRHAPYFEYRKQDSPAFTWQGWREACEGRFDATGLFEGFVRYETGTPRGSGIIWGDKSPTYIEHLPLLLALYPQASIVHIVRDVRDQCVSLRKAFGKDLRRAAHRWNECVLAARRRAIRNTARFHEVKYEELLEQPEDQLRGICEFLRLEFSKDMLQLDRPVEPIGDGRASSAILGGNHDKFAQRLTPAEIEAIESLAWEGMATFGYRPQVARGPRQLANFELTTLRLRDGISLALNNAKRRGLSGAIRTLIGHQRVVRG
jgi:hypothetical protein